MAINCKDILFNSNKFSHCHNCLFVGLHTGSKKSPLAVNRTSFREHPPQAPASFLALAFVKLAVFLFLRSWPGKIEAEKKTMGTWIGNHLEVVFVLFSRLFCWDHLDRSFV